MNQIRTFIAVEIPSFIKERITELQEQLKIHNAAIKWVNPGNIHITLKFLGNVAENKIAEIATAVSTACEQIEPFSINITGVGAFPDYKRPRVIWVGAESDGELLATLSHNIDLELSRLGFEREKRAFKAHLTMGRVKGLKGIRPLMDNLLENKNFAGGTFIVKEVIVMRSDLKPSGAIYTPLKKIEL